MLKSYPAWLGTLNQRDEARRRGEGLTPKKDGWYKSIRGKKRYICKPCPLSDAIVIAAARKKEIEGSSREVSARLSAGSTTIKQLGEAFIAHCQQRVTSGIPSPMSRRTFRDYCDCLARFIAVVGREQLAVSVNVGWFTMFAGSIAGLSPASRRRYIIYLTRFFNWAGPGRNSLNFYRLPVQFGPDLVKPSEAVMRRSMKANTSKLLTIDRWLGAMNSVRQSPLLRAAGMLALNCAFLPVDLISITLDDLDIPGAVHRFARGKTGHARCCWLHPRTIEALNQWIEVRPASSSRLLFVTLRGEPFGRPRSTSRIEHASPNTLGVYWRLLTRTPMSALRTTLATLCDADPDQGAVDMIMGHASSSIRAKHYVKQFDPARTKAVIERNVARWLDQVSPPAREQFHAGHLIYLQRLERGTKQRRSSRRVRSAGAIAANPVPPG